MVGLYYMRLCAKKKNQCIHNENESISVSGLGAYKKKTRLAQHLQDRTNNIVNATDLPDDIVPKLKD